MTETKHTLEVQELVCGHGEVIVLDGVSLTLRAGELTALIGANGAGKTTLLGGVVGSLRPRSGRVLLDGEDLTRLPPHARARRGLTLVPEGRRLFASMTVRENLEMGAAVLRHRGPKAKESLERMLTLFPRLRERIDQRAGTLSGGEQQMVALARGLMANPRVLLFDELSLGLSPAVTLDLASTLRKLRQSGQTMLLVEQNVHLALSLSDHAYVLAGGKIWMHGPSAELAGRDEIRRAFLGI